ncbi:MAG: TGS domain-containing protein [Candidatus Micrarchaeota archaeon]|nr:TGS domain-containing protein [Candidatus Micrarchaeota archaeon]
MASLNATPEYYAAEARYRAAKTFEEKKAALEEMLSLCPKHKGAQSILMEIKNRLARLRKEEAKEKAKKKAARGGRGEFVRKQGDAQVVLLGFQNAGKTALFNAVTGLRKQSTPVPFETREAAPGMMVVKKVQAQVIDTPSMNESNKAKLFAFARQADLVIIILDRGGGEAEAKGAKRFFDEAARVFLPGKNILWLAREKDYDTADAKSVTALKERIYSALGVVRVFTKTPRGEPDYEKPVVIKSGGTVLDVARQIHKELASGLDYARVWGSAKFPGQQVGADYEPADGDIVELHLK